MLHVRRRALIAVLAAGLAMPVAAGAAAATTGTYIATFCYDAANNQVVIHQMWSAMEVDTVTGGIGTGKHGFGFVSVLETPATSGDETDGLLADPAAKIVGGSVLDQGVTVGSQSVHKPHGGWSKLPAC
jgi:hypothetical protein